MIRINVLLMLVVFAAATAVAQKPMASPPGKAEGKIDGLSVVVDYHQPSAKGRKIMGGLVPYGEVWRTGANATTSIEFSADAKVEGKAIAKGKYALFTIPGEAEWTIIINKTIEWGSATYNEKDDVLRVKVKPSKTDSFVETFNIAVVGNKVVMKWENTQVAFTVSK
ncbi:MAG: DUF2911 domain-containing protein [Cyclobacteriaceae bacterium]|nr:DUF2911 domain-containing protein [Cyclobacteriaceae bacterium]